MKNLKRLLALISMFTFGVFLIPNRTFFAFADDCNCDPCSAGGKGSTSCSISGTFYGVSSSCEVTCQADYYACCNDDFGGISCKCCQGS